MSERPDLSDLSAAPSAPPVSRLGYVPGLDGLRAIAVIAVLLFHNEFSWAEGGFLGVSLFFTLSGFLITTLLLEEHESHGSVRPKRFYSRRFRRLMPASLLALLGICAFGAFVATAEQLQTLRGDILSALAYVANWHFITQDKSYASLFSQGSPVQHFWSLAIEEQFYIVFPLVVILALKFGGRRIFGWVLGVALVASLGWSFVLRDNLDRVYYGTDTRAAELLAGALLAWVFVHFHRRPRSRPRTKVRAGVLAAVGVVTFVVMFRLWSNVSDTDRFVTHGLLPLQALLSVVIIFVVIRPGLFGRALAWRPLVAIGLVSYGLYLFHWPIYLWLTRDRTGLAPWPLFALRIAVTGAVAIGSYFLLEKPIRRRKVLLRRGVIVPAVAGSLALVVVTTLVVTANPPASTVPYANFDVNDREVTVQTAPTTRPDPTASSTTAPVVPAPPAIMIVGDSGMVDASPGIIAAYQQLGTQTFVNDAFPGFGLARDPAGWEKDWPPLVAEHHPAVVLVMLGGWDIQAMQKDPAGYEALMEKAVSVLSADGAHIVWAGLLPGGTADPGLINPQFEALAARHPGVVEFFDPGPSLAAKDGTHPRWLTNDAGVRELARKPDGWHFCPPGAQRLGAAYVAFTAKMRWSPAPVTGWEQGAWRQDGRYNDPVGGCDPNKPSNADPGP